MRTWTGYTARDQRRTASDLLTERYPCANVKVTVNQRHRLNGAVPLYVVRGRSPMITPTRTFNSFTAAKKHVIGILSNSEGLSAPVSEIFDVDSIATRVIGPMNSGYPITVGFDAFWDIAEQHRR